MQETRSFFIGILNDNNYNDLGKMLAVTNTVIERKRAELALQISNDEHAVPNWIVTGDLNEETTKEALDALSQVGQGKVLVFPKDTKVERMRTPNENPHQPFIDTIQLYMSLVAGILTGQDTPIKDVKFVGSAESRERSFNAFVLDWQERMRKWVENTLFPSLQSFDVGGIPNPYKEMDVRNKRIIFESEAQSRAILADSMGTMSEEERNRLAAEGRTTPKTKTQKKEGVSN